MVMKLTGLFSITETRQNVERCRSESRGKYKNNQRKVKANSLNNYDLKRIRWMRNLNV